MVALIVKQIFVYVMEICNGNIAQLVSFSGSSLISSTENQFQSTIYLNECQTLNTASEVLAIAWFISSALL